MFSPLICGAFHPEEDEENDPWSPSSTPRKSRRKNNKNPYSMRGLDKFSELLADLEEKRQKIYLGKDSHDISFVRFVYSNSNDCVPIVVKSKNSDMKDKPVTNNSEALDKFPMESTETVQEIKQPRLESDNKTKKSFFAWNMKLKRWRRPSYYFPAAIILILLFLAFFGRSVAILCTSIGWYIVPTLKAGSSSSKRPTNKKVYVRRFSEIKMASDELSSPKANNTGAVKDKSPPRRHGSRKSWS